MAKLFGFSIEETQDNSASIISPVPKNNEDGVDNYIASGFYGQYVDIEGAYRSEHELIKRYREMALHPETDGAIEDVVNEAIVSDLYDSPVEVELSNLNASEGIKKKIREEFRYIKELMDFDKKSHEIFRNWYIDGRLYYLKVIDVKNPQEGLKDLRYIDPMKLKYIRQEKKTNGQTDPYVRINSKDDFVLVLDRIQDPGNMGNLFRTALAAGVDAIFLAGGAHPLSQKVLRASTGAVFHLPFQRYEGTEEEIINSLLKSLSELSNEGFKIFSTSSFNKSSKKPSKPYWEIDWTKSTVLILGNEGQGINKKIQEAFNDTISIPHSELVESLNVACVAVPLLLERKRVAYTSK